MKKATSIAIAEQQSPPINLVTVDAYFGIHDPDLAGLAVVRMVGDSMKPTFRTGDYALVDTRDNCVGTGIYAVLLYSPTVIIMQIQPVPGSSGRRVIGSWHNPVYGSEELTVGEWSKRSRSICERRRHRSRRVSSAAFSRSRSPGI
jgi:hypothetical protein